MAEKRAGDQKFAVICYAVAVCVATISTSVVQLAGVDTGSNLYLYLAFLLPQIAYVGTYFIAGKLMKKGGAFLRRENVRPLDYAFGVIVAAGLLFFALLSNSMIVRLFAKIGLESSVRVPTLDRWYDYALSTVVICVLPAIGEELIFRKAFLDGMENVPTHKAILLCGLAFSLSHMNPAQTVHQFFLGCVLALCYVLTKNVTVTMTMHCVNNALALYLERISPAGFWNTITVTGVSCAAGAVLLGVGLFLLCRAHKKELTEKKSGRVESATVILIAVLALAWVAVTAVSLFKK